MKKTLLTILVLFATGNTLASECKDALWDLQISTLKSHNTMQATINKLRENNKQVDRQVYADKLEYTQQVARNQDNETMSFLLNNCVIKKNKLQ